MFSPTYALRFDGSRDLARLEQVNNFPTDEITVSFWVRTSATNPGTFFSYATPGAANMVMIRDAAGLEFFLGSGDRRTRTVTLAVTQMTTRG